MSLDDVRVHLNSPKPARLEASAYTQGNEIHVGPRQEKYLAHEAWHVVQQTQGRVTPTAYVSGAAVNDVALARRCGGTNRESTRLSYLRRIPQVLCPIIAANTANPKTPLHAGSGIVVSRNAWVWPAGVIP